LSPLHAPEGAAHQSPSPEIAAFPPVFARVDLFGLQSRAWTIHIAFSRQGEHGASGILNRGFAVMALAMLCRAGAWWALMRSAAYAAGVGCASICPAAKAAEAELHVVAAKPACLNAAETREMVKSRHLLEPFAALKFAGAQRKAEALSARLCRTGDDFVYEITLLHRDGRLVHVDMEAGTGKIASRPPREPHEAHEPHDAHEPHESHEAHEPPVKN
jgi:hypothetical protein